MRSLSLALSLALPLFVACASGDDDLTRESGAENTGSTQQALRKNDPCQYVRCSAGFHCESKGRRASCVANDDVACTTDADCRLFDNYCDGCACQALNVTSVDPRCDGTIVQCFAQPCGGKTAVCASGACTVL